MSTYRIVERRSVTDHSVLHPPTVTLQYYIQRRRFFGWVDEAYAAGGGELGHSKKYWYDTFEEARQHVLGRMPDNVTKETIIVQYLNV